MPRCPEHGRNIVFRSVLGGASTACDNRHVVGAPAAEPKPTLGILFVHGIGEQKPGETLVTFADPISSWLTRWLTRGRQTEADVGSGSGKIVVTDTELVPGEGPAHCRLTIDAPGEDLGGERRWLLAESCWAETFRPPKTTALMTWLLLIIPYMILVQFYALFQRSKRKRERPGGEIARLARMAVGLFVYLCALPVAALGAVVAAVLFVALIVPIPQVSDRAKKVALLLSNTLGDAYVLTSSSVQFDAMVAHVADDLRWLSEKVEHVAVVAHSQGTVVSYEAIVGSRDVTNLAQFVTVGQGLKKLMLVRSLQTYGEEAEPAPGRANIQALRANPGGALAAARGRSKDRWIRVLKLKTLRFTLAWVGLAGFYVLLLFVPQLAVRAVRYHVNVPLTAGLAGAGALVVFFVMVVCARLWASDLEDGQYKPSGRWRWADFYASADPVPNGPLYQKTAGKPWLVEKEVWNRASFLRDHTTYTRSEDDFLGCLVTQLFVADGQRNLRGETEKLLRRGRWRGWWRVWWLSFARFLAIAGVIATVVRVWPNLKPIGHRVLRWGTWEPFHGILKAVLVALDRVVVVANPSHAFLVGLLMVAGVAAAGYIVLSLLWNYWERQDVKRFYRRTPSDDVRDPLGGREFMWFFLALLALSFLTAVIGWTRDYAAPWNWAVDHPVWVLVIVALLAALPVYLTWAFRRLLRSLEGWLVEVFPRDPPDRGDEAPDRAPVPTPR
jgi:hypothetical protein